MSSPKEKAEELYSKYETLGKDFTRGVSMREFAKQSALIAVDECIESTKQLIHHYTKSDNSRYSDIYLSMSISVNYWQEVKQEIENL